jgi:uncharacterized lipoprotein YmbA
MRWAPLAAALLAGACSTPKLAERFHTLLPAERATSAAAPNAIAVDVAPVAVPPQVDHAQWVVRQPDDSLLMLEQDRWAAPLGDELRSALAERLTAQWSAIDVRAVAMPASAVWRVRVDVQRFESVPGREARLEATWSLAGTQPGSAPPLVCRSAFAETPAAGGIPELAAAHRRAVTRLADAMGEQLRRLQAGQPGSCR